MLTKKLKELRVQADLTQQDVADSIGISRGRYSQYEIGKRNPNYATLKQIADFFKVSVDFLIKDEDVNPQQQQLTNKIYDLLIKKEFIESDEVLSPEKIDYIEKVLDKAIELAKLTAKEGK